MGTTSVREAGKQGGEKLNCSAADVTEVEASLVAGAGMVFQNWDRGICTKWAALGELQLPWARQLSSSFSNYLFICGCAGPLFLRGFFSSCSKWGLLSHCIRGLVAEHRFQAHQLSNCGAWASLLRGMWVLPGPGIEPVSPALAGGFLTTEPPGKPKAAFFFKGGVLGRTVNCWPSEGTSVLTLQV